MIEIERKFLVREFPPDFHGSPSIMIEQGYLAYDPEGVEVRLRRSGADRCLTIKRRSAEGREEHNVPLTADQFAALWPMTTGRRLAKIRHDLPYGDLTIEIDLFQGRHAGLRVAEVEFPNSEVAKSFQPPWWFGEELTGNLAYANRNLACE